MILHLLSFIVTAVVYALTSANIVDIEYRSLLLYVVLVVVANILSYAVRREHNTCLRGQHLRAVNVFMLSFFIVHFQAYIDILTNNFYDRYGCYYDTHVIGKTALLSLLGLLSCLIGYRYKHRFPVRQDKRQGSRILRQVTELSYKVSLFFLLASTAGFVLLNGTLYLSGTYSQEMLNEMAGTSGNYVIVLLECCIYSSTIIKCVLLGKRKGVSLVRYCRSFGITYYVCLFTYLFFVLMSGDRGAIIFFLMAWTAGYILLSNKKIPMLYIIAALLIASSTVAMLGLARHNQDTGSRFSADSMSEYQEDFSSQNTVSPMTVELSWSNRCAITAVRYFPDKFPHTYGSMSLYSVMTCIPFYGRLLKSLGIDPEFNISTAIMDYILNDGDENRAGNGSTVVADLYIEFGAFGVIVGLFLFGLMFRYLDVFVQRGRMSTVSLFMLVLFFVLFSKAVYIPRSVALGELRLAVWSVFVLYVIISISSLIRKH